MEQNDTYEKIDEVSKSIGTVEKNVGSAANIVGKTTNIIGSTTKVRTGTKYLGKGISSTGNNLNRTRYGVNLGIPFKENETVAGKKVESERHNTEKNNNTVKKTGKKLKSDGQNSTKIASDIVGDMPIFKSPHKVILIVGAVISLFIFIMFIVVLVTPLMALGIIDIDGIGDVITGGGGQGGYNPVVENMTHYLPIGSEFVSDIGGVKFAKGAPFTTNITSKFSAQEEFRDNIHHGIDFGNEGNGPGIISIIASKDGKVIYPNSKDQTLYEDNGYYKNPDGGGFGNYVMIEHDDGTVTLYAHLSKGSITVLNGDNVKRGQVIGKMGHSGSSTGTHLHFEVRVNGQRVDPLNYVSVTNPRPIKQ